METETIADIVREMRGDPSEQLSSWEDTINTRRIVRQFLVNYADRIEAAHKREVGACRNCELFQLDKDGMVHPVFESSEIERLRGALETAARWVATHDIYHNMGAEIVKEAEELLGKKVY